MTFTAEDGKQLVRDYALMVAHLSVVHEDDAEMLKRVEAVEPTDDVVISRSAAEAIIEQLGYAKEFMDDEYGILPELLAMLKGKLK